MTTPIPEALRAAEAPLVPIARRLLVGQLLGVGLLAAVHAVITWAGPHAFDPSLQELVHFDREGNLPTWFAISQLSLLTLTLLAVGFAEKPFRPGRSEVGWFALAAGALFVSVDEAALLHERVAFNLQALAAAAPPGSFYSRLRDLPFDPWVVVYGPGALLLGTVSVVFLWRRVGAVRVRAVGAIAAGVIAGIGLDVVESLLGGPDRPHPAWFDLPLLEEATEMVSVAVLTHALFVHLSSLVSRPAAAESD